ncbi:hypothetical protein [Priestia megaterium]|uniref:Uncharacterized protein n=1 Tax=Priestia megaterium TaxID=1404 RepID=A0A6M6E0B3_PRIMG|nr:hypothetical protein [Priestia megaterium]QJX80280.1 hypothetical protein FDZ14_29740 [Priestia megaterium]
MAMTLEQKVAKKAKGLDKLKYKKGLAIVLLGVEEEASEYGCDSRYRVRLYFKSKAAIKRFGEFLGSAHFNKKEMLDRFERGQISKDTYLNRNERWELEGGQNIIKDVKYDYRNLYSGQKYFNVLDPTKALTETQEGYYTGSVDDGEPLSEYISYLKQSIVDGSIQYIV